MQFQVDSAGSFTRMLGCVGVARGMLCRFCHNIPQDSAPQSNASGMNEL